MMSLIRRKPDRPVMARPPNLMAQPPIVMARLDRAISINTMNGVMARSSRAMTLKRSCDVRIGGVATQRSHLS